MVHCARNNRKKVNDTNPITNAAAASTTKIAAAAAIIVIPV